jgi:glucokinase
MSRTIAVADIGGTHARFALAEVRQRSVVSLGEAVTLRTSDHDDLQSAWAEFERSVGTGLPDALALAFAGYTGAKTLKLTNSPWEVRPELLHEQLSIAQVMIVNDFGAIAHAVAQLGPDHFEHCCGPQLPLPKTGLTTIIGPGTGIGVAQLLRTADGYQVLETEGGHVDFAPLDDVEDRILAHLRDLYSRVSVERVVSGSGLANLYGAMAALEGREVALSEAEMIWNSALDGSDPLAIAALDRFFLSFGSVAGDMALAHGASSVVIAGGLGYRLKHRLATSGFAGRFVAKGRFRERMEAIPVKLLDHPQPGLYGAAAAFAREHP